MTAKKRKVFFMHLCNVRGAELLKLLFFFCFSFALLSLNFYTNFLRSAEQGWFTSFDRESERLIIGRLIKSRQDGMFSLGGFPVSGVTDAAAAQDPLSWMYDRFDNYDAYIKNARVDYFAHPYYSQICGQGIFFSILDKYIPCVPSVKLRIFHGLASMLTALGVTAVIAWLYLEFGLFAGITVLAFAVISQWLTVFARSLWWSLWAFYLPMVTIILYFLCTEKNRYSQYVKLGSIVFFSILIKTIFNGYEYITTTLVMMITPFVYYSILDKVGLTAFFNGLIKIALSAGLAIAVSMCLLSFQIAAISGNFWDGFSHIKYTLQKRTHATSSQPPSLVAESLQAPTLPLVVSYLQGEFCGIDSSVFNSPASGPHVRYCLSYARLIMLFAVMTIILYLSAQRRMASSNSRRLSALIVASWFSILAPLSWFIIFKAHSYVHEHLNFIVWQMPFTFFGAAITGLAVRNSFSRVLCAVRNAGGTHPAV